MSSQPTGPQILDAAGEPMQRKKMLTDNSGVPYDAANVTDQRTAGWLPFISSADSTINPYRDRIVSRARDVVRNDGWGSGAITRILDNAIGASFRPVPKPDYRALAAATGNAAFDANWAAEFGRALAGHWRSWANDPNRYCDASRQLNMSQIFRLAFRHLLIDGDALAVMLWMPERVGIGRARYATSVQLIDPDRLSNPQNTYDQQYVRGGVQIDDIGAAVGYHIRRAHIGDWYSAAAQVTWDYVPRETEWGRSVVVHDFTPERAGQHRGGAGILTPVLQRLKMLIQYDGAELDASIINAIFGAYVSSPFDPELVASALGGSADEIGAYQEARSGFHTGGNGIRLGGARIPQLFPGEDIKTVSSTRPNSAFKEFEAAMLRNVASAAGMSYEQLSQNWSDTNYSSARAALLESWKTITRRRQEFADGFCNHVFSTFVEESMEVDDLPLPDGAPSFIEMRAAYSNCNWLAPGRGWIDPLKERQGAILGMESGLSTLESEAADSSGVDYEEVLDQRQIEIEAFRKRGIPLPSWAIEIDQSVVTERLG